MSSGSATPSGSPEGTNERSARLDSWKEIAAYLNRDIRTVQRWEKVAGLPVRRLQKPGLRAVFAYTSDLDEWLGRQGSTTTEEPPGDTPGAVTAPSRSRRRWVWYAAIGTLIAIAAAFSVHRPRAPEFGPFTARPITSDPSVERDPDISPDGLYVAYITAGADQERRLQVRLIDGGEPRAVTSGLGNEWSPAWSPDGARIAFLRGLPDADAQLFVIPANGGVERKIADVRPYPRRRTLLVGHLLAWTPDGRRIIVPDRAKGEPAACF
jgi:hypothetical protein